MDLVGDAGFGWGTEAFKSLAEKCSEVEREEWSDVEPTELISNLSPDLTWGKEMLSRELIGAYRLLYFWLSLKE